MLYTCAAEFDFMQVETIVNLSKTLLLASVFIAVLAVLVNIFVRLDNISSLWIIGQRVTGGTIEVLASFKDVPVEEDLHVRKLDDKSRSIQSNEINSEDVPLPQDETRKMNVMGGSRTKESRSVEHAEFVYSVFQLGAFTVMAAFFMRLKLFWTPYLCLMTSLLASRKLFSRLLTGRNHLIMLSILIALMSVEGIKNIRVSIDDLVVISSFH